MPIQATVSYHYPPIKMANYKKPNHTSIGKEVEQQKLSFTADGNAKFRIQFGAF